MCLRNNHTFTITEGKIKQYASLSGDFNRLHLDQYEAERNGFKAPIAHGMLTMGLISSGIASDFIEKGMRIAVYELHFIKPVYMNQTISVNAEMKLGENDRTHLMIKGWNENEIVVKGELMLEKI